MTYNSLEPFFGILPALRNQIKQTSVRWWKTKSLGVK